MSGCAWQVSHRTGKVDRWIEAPYPKTAISLAVFLHEVGHHAIGFDRFRKRCEEEYHVWLWAMAQMRHLGVEPDAKVLRRFDLSMRYAVGKAIRRGIRNLPSDLMQFADPCRCRSPRKKSATFIRRAACARLAHAADA
jgi:hypothetical protein